MAAGLIRALLERLRQLEGREEQIRDEKETIYARLIVLTTPGADTGAADDAGTVRRVEWRASTARQRAIVIVDRDQFELPLRLGLVFFALLKLGHGAGGDPLAYRSALEIATWMADHRPNGVCPSLHCVESYISKLRKLPEGRFALLIEGNKQIGWRLAVQTPIVIAREP